MLIRYQEKDFEIRDRELGNRAEGLVKRASIVEMKCNRVRSSIVIHNIATTFSHLDCE